MLPFRINLGRFTPDWSDVVGRIISTALGGVLAALLLALVFGGVSRLGSPQEVPEASFKVIQLSLAQRNSEIEPEPQRPTNSHLLFRLGHLRRRTTQTARGPSVQLYVDQLEITKEGGYLVHRAGEIGVSKPNLFKQEVVKTELDCMFKFEVLENLAMLEQGVMLLRLSVEDLNGRRCDYY